jgi:hypothetical protein
LQEEGRREENEYVQRELKKLRAKNLNEVHRASSTAAPILLQGVQRLWSLHELMCLIK